MDSVKARATTDILLCFHVLYLNKFKVQWYTTLGPTGSKEVGIFVLTVGSFCT